MAIYQSYNPDQVIPSSAELRFASLDRSKIESIQAGNFYDQTDLYESFIGKVKNKEFQSYESKDD